MSPGPLSFAKLVMMSSARAKSAGDARYASQDPFIQSERYPIQSRLQSVLEVRSFFIARNELFWNLNRIRFGIALYSSPIKQVLTRPPYFNDSPLTVFGGCAVVTRDITSENNPGPASLLACIRN